MSRKKISVLIVDDEALGRDFVRLMLRAHADIQVVAECADGEKALAAIKRHRPDLVFLDIQMPRVNGLALLQRLEGEHRPLVVFVTAYDAYAIKAFEAQALDYLLKPFDQDRFDQMLARARSRLVQIGEINFSKNLRGLLSTHLAPQTLPCDLTPSAETRSRFDDRVTVKESGRIFFINVPDIDWLEASGNYVALHVAGRSHLIHETMSSMEARLNPAHFVRLHRSAIANVERIKELRPHFNGEYIVVLKDGTRLKLSRGQLAKARVALGLD